MGAVSGGERMKAYLRKIAKEMQNAYVDVGFMENARYPDGTGVAEVAYQNEFGRPENNQPPRPFFRQMIENEKDTWPDKIVGAAKHYDYNALKILGAVGEDIKGALEESITALTLPKLAESTIAKKGFDKPLIDTGVMLNSITSTVNTGNANES